MYDKVRLQIKPRPVGGNMQVRQGTVSTQHGLVDSFAISPISLICPVGPAEGLERLERGIFWTFASPADEGFNELEVEE